MGSFAATLLLAAASPAIGCYSASGERAIIHSALPRPLPPDAIVAEVEILSGNVHELYGTGVLASVTQIIQGHAPGNMLILRWPGPSDCDRPFDNGRRGYIIAIARGTTPAGLIVEPFPASRGAGFHMREGEPIPDEWRRNPPGWKAFSLP